MNNYHTSKAVTSPVKDYMRALATVIVLTSIKGRAGRKPSVSSLPAKCGLFEKAILPFVGKMNCYEVKKDIYNEMKNSMPSSINYFNSIMTNAGHDDSSIVWADYCCEPTPKNIKIKRNTKLALFTFGIGGRGRSNTKNKFRKEWRLLGSPEDRIEWLKKYYSKKYPDYELITCVRYVSAIAPMVLIGLAKKSLNFPSKQKEIQKDLTFNFSESPNSTKKSKKELKLFKLRVERMAKRINFNLTEVMANTTSQEKPKEKERMKKTTKNNNATDLTQALKDATRILYLSGKLTDDEIMQTLGITRMKLAGTKAYCSRYGVA